MRLAKSLCSLLCLPFLAVADPGPLGISFVDTTELRLFYSDPSLNFLVPHTARTFSNAFDWQRRIFGWEPSERTTVWLRDFADYGNAGVSPTPKTFLRIDVAPMANAFETNPSNERMYSTMNHEMVHVATTDLASSEDRRWRSFFLGKVAPQSTHPESLLYSYLTVPRFTVPRWYLEGSAVFMETWMAGGLGRAQGGYDEMVFRAMVRDDAHFYDPLGLVSRGTRVDFQGGANAYLYGGRFFTWLAYAHSPEKVVAWLRRDEGSRRHYADQFEQVFGMSLERAWQDWIAFEHEFQRKNLAEVRKHPITPQRNLAATAMGSVSRAYLDEASGVLYAGVRYPGIVDHVAALNMRDGSARTLAEIKGAMLYSVTSLAFDPASRTGLLHDRQPGFSQPDRGRRRQRRGNASPEGGAHRQHRVQSRRPLADRRAPQRRAGDAGAHSLSLRRLGDGARVSLRRGAERSRRLGRRSVAVGIDHRRRRRPVPARVDARDAARREHRPAERVPLRPVGARELRLHEGWPLSLRQQLLHRRLEHLPLRSRDRRREGGVERRDRLLPADPDGRRSPGRVQLHGRGIHAGDHRAAAARGPERDHLPRHRSGRAASGRHDLAGAAGQRRRLRLAGEVDRGLPPARRGAAAQRLSGPGGIQDHRGRRLPPQPGRSARLRASRHHRCVHARPEPAGQRARPRLRRWTLPRLARRPGLEPLELLRPLRPDAARSQGLRGHARLRPVPDLRAAEAARGQLRPRVLRQDRYAAGSAERGDDRSTACSPARSPCATATCAARSAPWRTRRASPGPQSPRGIGWRTRR